MTELSFILNGGEVKISVDDNELLCDVIRDKFNLKALNVGCDTSSCGACTVLLNGVGVKSCTVLAQQVESQEVETLEGLSKDGELHPVQKAFKEKHGLQCGFCTPGMIMQGVSLLNGSNELSESEIRIGIEGNICRCTGYQTIVDALLLAQCEINK